MSLFTSLRAASARIQMRILAPFIGAMVLGVAVITIVVSVRVSDSFIRNFETNSLAQLARMNEFVSTFLDSGRQMTELLAANPLIQEAPGRLTSYVDRTEEFWTKMAELPEFEQRVIGEFAKIQKAFPAYEIIYMGDSSNGFAQYPDDSLSAHYAPLSRSWYAQAAEAPGAVVTEAYLSTNNEAVCTIAAPVRDARNRVQGVVAFDINLKTLTSITDNVRIGATGFVLIIDQLGTVITDPQLAMFKDMPERVGTPILFQNVDDIARAEHNPQPALAELFRKGGGIAEVVFDGRERLAAVHTTPEGWALIMMIDKDEVFADAMGVTRGILYVGLAVLVVMLLIGWLVARSIAQPVNILANASLAVAGGDLNAIPEANFKGELGILHSSLQRMVAKLAELVNTAELKIHEAEDALAQSETSLAQAEEAKAQADRARREGVLETAAELSGIVEQLGLAAAELSEQLAQAEQGTRQQSDCVAETAGSIREMNQAVGDVARSASAASDIASQAREQASGGLSLVKEVLGYIAAIAERSESMQGEVGELGQHAQAIGEIMDMIREIADQTNLLALNAAIEAARAGEHGRGFAVVADEVRKLAEKTAQSTASVADVVVKIRSSAEASAASMKEVAGVVAQSTEVAGNAGEALLRIDELVEHTADQVRAIAAASEEQSAMADGMNRATEDLNALTVEVSAASVRCNETVGRLSGLSQQLNDVVGNLQKS